MDGDREAAARRCEVLPGDSLLMTRASTMGRLT
jgi:hypothetical protein